MVLDKDIKLVIFDFDGTLSYLDVDWAALKAEINTYGGETLGEAIQRLHAAGHPDIQKVTSAELAGTASTLSDEITNVLRTLTETKLVAVLTRNSRRVVERVITDAELKLKLFVIGREDVERLKPDPEGLRSILKHFKVAPQQAVLVGDTWHDVVVAHGQGVKSIIVDNPYLEHRPEGASVYITKLTDLTV